MLVGVGERPPGTVTFLFTDVEGSTRLWEQHPIEMQAALERHDEILRAAIEGHGGFVFTTAGDAFAAAFARARDAVDAAVTAQRGLGAEPWPDLTPVRVRMGLHTGEAQERGGDYFGSALNRAARVMAAGHGGQILVAASTAAVVDGVELVDLGEHRLKDLSAVEHLFQVSADGLSSEFAALRTLDETPGNLPAQVTSFVGRDLELKELSELVKAHRMVTLTGVGGVGKTRLAVQVAAELLDEFPDGVWLVELASVGDPAAVPDVVATALGITSQAELTVTDSVAEALSGRRLLVVLDNCEHVLDAAADLVEMILARSETVKIMATSREGLRVGAEHLWSVPSLDVASGVGSAAVELFLERAQAVDSGFALDGDVDVAAVTETCQRLDGIALAIELAAARMVSMTPTDVRDRLGDRFRLLSGSRRGLERHQTLRHAVGWSYDLLEVDERALLNSCAVFADGFDLAAATHIRGEDSDEYAVLDALDSLVRKSLVTTERVNDRARYGLLETIRQFAEDQLADTGTIDQARDRHAAYFAEQAVAYWDIWNGPEQRVAVDWVDVEFANLRTGFRWATDQDDLVTATAIAAHTVNLAFNLQRHEAVGWTEEILDAATTADVVQLPRLYCAASHCMFTGRPAAAAGYIDTALQLGTDPRYEPFFDGWAEAWEAAAHIVNGRLDRMLEICAEMVTHGGFARVYGLAQGLYGLPAAGRAEEAMAIADEALNAPRDHGGHLWISVALNGYGRAFSDSDPARALNAYRQGLDYTRENRVPIIEAYISADVAALEAVHGDFEEALELFDASIVLFHRAGDHSGVGSTFGQLAVFFDRFDRPEIAATVYGASARYGLTDLVVNLADVVEHLRSILGESGFDESVATGAAMELADAVEYARRQIKLARPQQGNTQ